MSNESIDDLRAFLKWALEPENHLRRGQKLMLELHKRRPIMYDRLQKEGIDAFYEDRRLWECVRFITKHWDDADVPQ